MALSKLGDYIEWVDERNSDNFFGVNDLKGISINKKLISTKANTDGLVLSGYKVVRVNQFAYCVVTSRNGNKISIAFNDESDCIISSINPVFRVKNDNLLLPRYLMMFFNRFEFDRYARYNSWGSARETFSWDDMRNIELEIPPIDIQRKYVSIYEAMLSNFNAYAKSFDDLKLACDILIENLKKNNVNIDIGKYLILNRNRNLNKEIKSVYGVSNTLEFIDASLSIDKENLSNYKVVNYEDIAYVPTTHMKIWAVAISNKKEPFVISPIYEVFRVKDKDILCPEYLFLWLCRKETIRYGFYNSWGSARENFVFDDLCTIKMPIPKIDIQRDIAEIFRCYCLRQNINEKLEELICSLCPILIRGAVNEAKRGEKHV